jgi:hypothetical protein
MKYHPGFAIGAVAVLRKADEVEIENVGRRGGMCFDVCQARKGLLLIRPLEAW